MRTIERTAENTVVRYALDFIMIDEPEIEVNPSNPMYNFPYVEFEGYFETLEKAQYRANGYLNMYSQVIGYNIKRAYFERNPYTGMTSTIETSESLEANEIVEEKGYQAY